MGSILMIALTPVILMSFTIIIISLFVSGGQRVVWKCLSLFCEWTPIVDRGLQLEHRKRARTPLLSVRVLYKGRWAQ